MAVRTALFLLCLVPAAALCQSGNTVIVPTGVPQGSIESVPANMQLVPKSAAAHPGKVWVRSADDGLHIWGKVETADNKLFWPGEKSEMGTRDHVEIWLSAVSNIDMPVIGFGNQKQELLLKNPSQCTSAVEGAGAVHDCQIWYKEQLQYRKDLAKLFTRHWVASSAPQQMTGFYEDYATAAWAELQSNYYDEELPTALAPHEAGITSSFDEVFEDSPASNAPADAAPKKTIIGYTFQFFVPWSAFPPAQELNLRDLWLTVDVVGDAGSQKSGPLSSTSPQRIAGQPSTFNHLVLDEARKHEITPCRASGAEKDLYGEVHPAWYFPVAGSGAQTISTVYDMENPTAGDMDTPRGVSPLLHVTEHFWKPTPDGGFVCGPDLAFSHRNLRGETASKVAAKYLETKSLPDGWLLVRSGPDVTPMNRFGVGQCGMCPVARLRMYAVSPSGEVAAVLDLKKAGSTDKRVDGGDFAIAPDWSRVTAYEEFATYGEGGKPIEKPVWTATSYCLSGHAYSKCGEEKDVTPPDPPNFKLF